MNKTRIFDKDKNIFEKEDSIRPTNLDNYIGQSETKENIKVFIKSAVMRNTNLDHVLLYGPPGLGKTTLAYILSNEMNTNIKTSSGPSIEKPADLAAVLSNLKENDILFIDEIHRLPRIVEEMLYSAMEDYYVDIIVGHETNARTLRIDLPKFTLIGATTRAGDLSAPLRDRFPIICKLKYYNNEELTEIVKRSSRVLNFTIDEKAAFEIARRSRATPRIANRILKRVRDFAIVEKFDIIDLDITKRSLLKLQIDDIGLDSTDYLILKTIIEKFNGGPVGTASCATTIGEEASTIVDVYEPYLLQIGLLKRTPRGRIATKKAYEHLNIVYDKE